MLFGRLRKIAKATISFVVFVCPSVNSAITGCIFIKFDIRGTLHEDLCAFMGISRSALIMRNVSDRTCRKNQNTHFIFIIPFFRKWGLFLDHLEKCGRAIIWKNVVEPDRSHMTIRRTRCSCWITKATDTHSEYVILTVLHGNNGYTNAPRYCVYACIACSAHSL